MARGRRIVSEYKDGRGDYYLAEGRREDRKKKAVNALTITKEQLVYAVAESAASAIGLSYETHAEWIWQELARVSR